MANYDPMSKRTTYFKYVNGYRAGMSQSDYSHATCYFVT